MALIRNPGHSLCINIPSYEQKEKHVKIQSVPDSKSSARSALENPETQLSTELRVAVDPIFIIVHAHHSVILRHFYKKLRSLNNPLVRTYVSNEAGTYCKISKSAGLDDIGYISHIKTEGSEERSPSKQRRSKIGNESELKP